MWLCSISSAPNVSFECKCYFKNIDEPFDSLLIKTNSKYKYIYDETVFNIYGINENGEFGIGSMYVISRNVEILEEIGLSILSTRIKLLILIGIAQNKIIKLT